MNTKRLACVYIPDFLIHICLIDNSHWRALPVAVAEGSDPGSLLVAVNKPAAAAGVALGMTVTQAHCHCPNLQITQRDCEREEEESGRLIKLLQSVVPLIEFDSPGLYYLEVGTVTRLYGSEEKLARRIIHCLKLSGYSVRTGIAGNKLVSRIAAGCAKDNKYCMVPAHTEKAFLAPLAIERLMLPSPVVEKLHALGIRTVRQLAVFPANEITCRFGNDVIELAFYARGEDPSLFLPERLPDEWSRQIIFDYPVGSSVLLCNNIEKTIRKLLYPLITSRQACQTIILTVCCQDHSEQTIAVTLDQPTASVSRFMRQIRDTLKPGQIPTGVTSITLAIPSLVDLSADQLALDRKLTETAKKEIKQIPGLNHCRLFVAQPQAELCPEESFTLVAAHTLTKAMPSGNNDTIDTRRRYFSLRSIAGLRLLNPATAVRVAAEADKLRSIRFRGYQQSVVYQSGPWILSGHWWRYAFNRFYYEIETAEHHAFLLYYDRVRSHWFLQGIFD